MKILFWNIRGISNFDSRLALKDFCTSHNPLLIFISQLIVSFSTVPSCFWKSIHVTKFFVNNRDPLTLNLWALCGADGEFVVRFTSSQCVVLESVCNNSKVYIVGVYASTYYLKRRQLWADLTSLQNFYTAPWISVGDLNAVL